MRSNFILIVCFIGLIILKSYSQTNSIQAFVNVDNVPVSLYSDRLSENVVHTIMNDSIFEHWYVVEILQESSLRYEVNVMCLQYNTPKIHGWIDKKYCSVYLGNNAEYLLLRNAPNIDAEYAKVSVDYRIRAVLCHIEENGFIFVEFQKNNKYYSGWIKDYCPSPIDSCN